MARSIASTYLAMNTHPAVGSASEAAQALINSDLRDLGAAVRKLVSHALVVLGDDLGCATVLLKWLAFLAAVYLLALDRTNWQTNMLTALLVPYIFFTLPNELFHLMRGEVGKWMALVTVVLRLFYPRRFPEWLELPGAVILLVAVAPNLAAYTSRADLLGEVICLVIGSNLLQEHVRASGGIGKAFEKGKRVSNTVGILLLFIYPVSALALGFM